ncbi:FHA domain-containing protein [Enhygromyxa salina]|uniref:FHA domain-containing protein n=1 Tax=Enhygromyxa salina TaxID=215803 RepID=UPI0015E74768|nr:FHA domain-containing protein [Enhygromyxa salina]
MAVLEDLAAGIEHELASVYVIGRSHGCDLCIARPSVSGLHAEIIWDGEAWWVQDLGSRNGTFHDGRRLSAGERAAVPEGTTVAFGTLEHSYQLKSAAPPRMLAKASDGLVLVAVDDILCLPSPEACELSIFCEADGRWMLESEAGKRALQHREIISVGGKAWELRLPAPTQRTREVDLGVVPDVDNIGLDFAMSRDGEHVEVTLHTFAGAEALKFRSHLFLLAALARQRVADMAQEHLGVAEHGWAYRDDLLRELDIDVQLMNLWIHRVRQQLAQAGVQGAGAVIERRSGSQQLRIGVGRLTVRTG